MKRTLSDGGTVTLRALSSQIAFWALAGIATVFVGDAAVRGRWVLAVRTAAILGLLVWAAWLFLIRMSVRLDAAGITAYNLGRVAHIPWPRVVDIRRRTQLVVDVDEGGTVECWGGPFAPRPVVRGSRPAADVAGRSWRGRSATGSAPRPDPALDTMRAAWLSTARTHTRHPEPETPIEDAGEAVPTVTHTWDVPALVVGAALLVCTVAALLL